MKIDIGSYYIIRKNSKYRCVKILNFTTEGYCFCECFCCEKKKFITYISTSRSIAAQNQWIVVEELQPAFINNMLREDKLERITGEK